jgi:regulator of RNase E activity RraA
MTSLNHAGDNLMLHAAVEVAEPGDVLVVATLSPSTHGMFGELLATQCRAQGIAGVVLDAGVRDRRDLQDMAFPVWSGAVSAAGTVKASPGWVNVPVVCGSATVNPGDLIIAEDDGAMVIPLASRPASSAWTSTTSGRCWSASASPTPEVPLLGLFREGSTPPSPPPEAACRFLLRSGTVPGDVTDG